MSAHLSQSSDGIIEIEVSGSLSFDELKEIQRSAGHILKPDNQTNCLITVEQFKGWERDGDWGDTSFLMEADPLIGRIGVVSEKSHKDGLMLFLCAGLREAEVRHFLPDEATEARAWVTEN
jgi:hypothetical protein